MIFGRIIADREKLAKRKERAKRAKRARIARRKARKPQTPSAKRPARFRHLSGQEWTWHPENPTGRRKKT